MKRSFLSKTLSLFMVSGAAALMLACGNAINSPVVKASVMGTNNPLVAQYTIVSGCVGQAMVEFGTDTSYNRNTNWVPLAGRYQSTNIFVAGMRASTTYHMRSKTQCSGSTETTTSPDATFTTGPLPSISVPPMTVSRPSPSSSSPENPGIELVDIIHAGNNMQAFFTDRDANVIWYYDVGQDGAFPFVFKLLPNGNLIFDIVTQTREFLREVDLAGNTIREADPTDIGNKVQASFGFNPATVHHDILPLANGHLILLMNFTQAFTDLPGYAGTTNVIGDALVDLDENWNPVWAWNSFDHLDVNRHLNGLPDWTHSNAVIYSPSDGNLLLSMRHQSWVLKIDYNNGSGTGNVLWKLGYQGDFALTQNGVPTDDPSQWFSFQHFPSMVSQSGMQTTLAVWDNGNNRVLDTSGAICSGAVCYSRATVYQVDESSNVANLLWDDLPGFFGQWGGSINQLGNGNVEFDMNAPATPVTLASEVQEVTQTPSPEIVWKMDVPAQFNMYRAYRVPSLYPGVAWQY